MKMISLGRDGSFVSIVDDEDYEALRQHRWHRHKLGYAYRLVWRGKKYVKGVYMHREVLGNPPTEVDHINRNRLDNRRSNLRPASRSLNGGNRGPQSNNTSGYCGVNWNKGKRKWEARIKVSKKQMRLGYFANIEDAAKVRKEAEILFGICIP